MLTQKIFATFDSDDSSLALPDLCRRLLEQQTGAWRTLADGRTALARAKLRRLNCAGFDVELQYNPRRIVSTSARVDPASLKARRCFLCPEHLPREQQGIFYRERFLILCNPAPIFDGHLTISSVVHEPQVLRPWMADFLELSRDLGPRYAVLYNGPRCGASAPDHLHFQASPAGSTPAERDLFQPERLTALITVGGVAISRALRYGREAIVLTGRSAGHLSVSLGNLLTALPHDPEGDGEPMVNVMASHRAGEYRLVVFPRKKHRPSGFFLDGEEKITVSPAVVDMAGLVITPVEKDYLSLDAAKMEDIYREVTGDASDVERAFAALAGKGERR